MVNELWPDGPRFKDGGDVFRLGTDSVLLSGFVKTSRAKRAADLGCGSGVISILLAWQNPGLYIDGLDINPDAVRLSRENAALNGFSDRIFVKEGDLCRHRDFFAAGIYDLTVSNPPYYAMGRGRRAVRGGMAAARGEEFCTLLDVCTAASYLTRWGGSFTLVHKPERLSEVFGALSQSGFEPKRMRFVQHRAQSPPSLVLLESRRGGKPSMTVMNPLILENNDGGDSEEIKRIYHRDC